MDVAFDWLSYAFGFVSGLAAVAVVLFSVALGAYRNRAK